MNNNKKVNKDSKALFVAILLVLSFVALTFFILKSCSSQSDDEDAYYQNENEQIIIGDDIYVPKSSLETCLVIGCDKNTTDSEDGLADFICVAIIDNAEQELSLLHINRDTYTEVHTEDKYGRSTGNVTEQISLSYGYGVTESAKCLNTVNSVENLLFGAEIDHYISLKMDDISVINDLIGGVTLEVLDDFPDSDILYAGNTVTLYGDMALQYVRSRGEMEDKTNLSRMKRQRQYMNAFIEQAKSYLETNPNIKLSDYDDLEGIITDYSNSQLQALCDKIKDYQFEGIFVIDGEAVEQRGLMAFYPDEDSLRNLVLDLFYKIANN